MISIQRSQIPDYLHSSEFYLALGVEEGEEFSIPKQNLKLNATVNSPDDVVHLLHTMRYWGIPGIPQQIVKYICSMKANTNEFEDAEHEFGIDMPWFTVLLYISSAPQDSRMLIAIRSGVVDLVRGLRQEGAMMTDVSYPCREALLLGHLGMLKYASWRSRFTGLGIGRIYAL